MKTIGIGAVLLFTKDVDRLTHFYREVLELPLEEETHPGAPRHFGCQIGDVHFALHTSAERGRGAVTFSLLVESLDRAASELERHGLTFLHAPIEMGRGARRSTIADPDGNRVSLVEPSPEWINKSRA